MNGLGLDIEGLHGIPGTGNINWPPVRTQMRNRLTAILNKKPTAQLAAEARKITVMIHAIDSGDDASAKELLDIMPYVEINATGELISNRPLNGLEGKFLDAFKKAGSFVKKVVAGVKGKTASVKKTATSVKSAGKNLKDKASDFFKDLTTIKVDTTSSLDKSISENWYKYLGGFAAVVTIAAAGYKLATRKKS